MIIKLDDRRSYMQRSHDEKFGFLLRFYRAKNPGMPLEGIAELMGTPFAV